MAQEEGPTPGPVTEGLLGLGHRLQRQRPPFPCRASSCCCRTCRPSTGATRRSGCCWPRPTDSSTCLRTPPTTTADRCCLPARGPDCPISDGDFITVATVQAVGPGQESLLLYKAHPLPPPPLPPPPRSSLHSIRHVVSQDVCLGPLSVFCALWMGPTLGEAEEATIVFPFGRHWTKGGGSRSAPHCPYVHLLALPRTQRVVLFFFLFSTFPCPRHRVLGSRAVDVCDSQVRDTMFSEDPAAPPSPPPAPR